MTRTFNFAVAVVFFTVCFVLLSPCALAAGGGGDANLNPMEFFSNTAFWTLLIFLTVFLILWKFAFGPIAKALDEREQGIHNNISAAQKQNEDAKELLKQYQQKLDDSREEVRQIIENAKKDAQRQADDIVAKAREAAGLERDRAMREIESATTSALQSLAQKSAEMATQLAGKMIRAEIKQEQHQNLINAAFQEFTTRG